MAWLKSQLPASVKVGDARDNWMIASSILSVEKDGETHNFTAQAVELTAEVDPKTGMRMGMFLMVGRIAGPSAAIAQLLDNELIGGNISGLDHIVKRRFVLQDMLCCATAVQTGEMAVAEGIRAKVTEDKENG